MSKHQNPELDWNGNVPVARRFDDPYFSLADGLAETRHVFLEGNGLPARFTRGFHIAELGFGTGLNALAALAAWRGAKAEGQLQFTTFELFPMAPADMARALAVYPEMLALAEPVLAALEKGARRVELPDFALEMIVGDARSTLPLWSSHADAWFLDGFSPARNPELWEPELLNQVALHTVPGGTAATYSAAGHVRRSLAAAGFEVERRQGYGQKRHMTVARLP